MYSRIYVSMNVGLGSDFLSKSSGVLSGICENPKGGTPLPAPPIGDFSCGLALPVDKASSLPVDVQLVTAVRRSGYFLYVTIQASFKTSKDHAATLARAVPVARAAIANAP